MHGNVWEWVEDAYRESYEGAPLRGSQAVAGNKDERRVRRGGFWEDHPASLRSAARDRGDSDLRLRNVGFRLARTI